jgi:hypothetical protein
MQGFYAGAEIQGVRRTGLRPWDVPKRFRVLNARSVVRIFLLEEITFTRSTSSDADARAPWPTFLVQIPSFFWQHGNPNRTMCFAPEIAAFCSKM